jgi:hypothetical protein
MAALSAEGGFADGRFAAGAPAARSAIRLFAEFGNLGPASA